jgi:hypothetical protein
LRRASFGGSLFGSVTELLNKPGEAVRYGGQMKLLGIRDSTDRLIDILLGLFVA